MSLILPSALVAVAATLATAYWMGGFEARVEAQMTSREHPPKEAASAEVKPSGPRTADPKGVLERLSERRQAIRSLTARGQSIVEAPKFTTTTREDKLEFYPCQDCHEGQTPNPKVRKLEEEHETLVFEHGGGRFWCYDACHNPRDMNKLQSVRGEQIGFNEAYKLCGQCHFQRQKDWYFGGHGKRAGSIDLPREAPRTAAGFDFSDREKIGHWQGARVLHICTDCHNAHSPSIKAYEPSPPPQARTGLQHSENSSQRHTPVWEARTNQRGDH